jgi:hypothetical protein
LIAEAADAAGDATSPVAVSVAGDPTPEEIAAIVAAVQTVWARPQAAVVPDEPMRWRFSGRWWSKPVPTRRARPA